MDATQYYQDGVAYHGQSMWQQAIDCYEHAIALNPAFIEAWNNLSEVYRAQNNLVAVEVNYQKAIQHNPQNAPLRNQLGLLYLTNKDLQNAIDCFHVACEINPTHPAYHQNLAIAVQRKDGVSAARPIYKKVLELAPAELSFYLRWLFVTDNALRILERPFDTDAFEKEFCDDIHDLADWCTNNKVEDEDILKAVGSNQPFLLAYREQNNVNILHDYGDLCSDLMKRWQPTLPTNEKRARLRIGIVSANIIQYHSVWEAIIKGWISQLDKTLFEIQVFNLHYVENAALHFIESEGCHMEHDHHSVQEWLTSIKTQAPDVLLYPAIGMDKLTLQLACLRLAPLQMVAWGHPETTGLPTIDYYLSAQLFECKEAQQHYTEVLVSLPNLGCYYDPPEIDISTVMLENFPINFDAPVLLSASEPYKYKPEYDFVFVDIIKRLPHAQIVFFTSSYKPAISQAFKERLQVLFESENMPFDKNIIFIPWQFKDVFYALMKKADVLLDPIAFSGFNTVIQAIECDLPTVTCENRFMRGRFASGILHKLNLQELVADNTQHYVEVVTNIVSDSQYRNELKNRINKSKSALFADVEPVRALERLILPHFKW